MPDPAPGSSPGALAAVLGALKLELDGLAVDVREVAVPSYGPGGRPSSVLRAFGGGAVGRGEHVGWTLAEHERFAARVREASPAATGSVTELRDALGPWPEEPPYARAAVEAALVDLALGQRNLSLADLGAPPSAALRFAISFERVADPGARIDAHAARTPGARFKIDVDPRWSAAAIDGLAERAAAVAVLDFKGEGDARLVHRLAERVPAALLEDPPLAPAELPAELVARVARDAAVRRAADVDALATSCGAINVKAPRMGGFLEVLEALERARAHGRAAYFGGMFEVDVGRGQARALAAIFTGAADNDLAPIPLDGEASRPPSPLEIRLDAPGFGATSELG